MKTVIVECKFVIEVPWEEKWGDPTFQIEENSCPGTSAVDGALSKLMDAADKAGVCWACTLNGENKILFVEDRPPRDYVGELTYTETVAVGECPSCGGQQTTTTRRNASTVIVDQRCNGCANTRHSMNC